MRAYNFKPGKLKNKWIKKVLKINLLNCPVMFKADGRLKISHHEGILKIDAQHQK